MKKYEFRYVVMDVATSAALVTALNTWGAEGWYIANLTWDIRKVYIMFQREVTDKTSSAELPMPGR